MKHTPGPWVASGNGVHFGTECVATTHMEPREQRQADARLIAAAPDLLEALRDLEKEFRRVFPIYYYSEPWAHDKNEKLKYAQAIIAKATGEQQ
jgi:hypothetical protein